MIRFLTNIKAKGSAYTVKRNHCKFTVASTGNEVSSRSYCSIAMPWVLYILQYLYCNYATAICIVNIHGIFTNLVSYDKFVAPGSYCTFSAHTFDLH